MKKCPFCKELIQDDAIKCRFCKEFLEVPLETQVTPEVASAPPPKKVGFFFRVPWIVGFLFLGPFMLPIVLSNPRYSRNKKIIVSSLIVLITAALVYAVVWAISILVKYYSMVFM